MKRAKQARDGDQAIPQNWTSLQVGDFVDVIEPGGYTYTAFIETISEKSDIVWIRAWGFGTRHLLHELDGTQLKPSSETGDKARSGRRIGAEQPVYKTIITNHEKKSRKS